MTLTAILTGDIVNSSKLSAAQLDRAMDALERTCASVRHWEGVTLTRFSRVSGDGWQMALAPSQLAARAALAMRAAVLCAPDAEDTRVSIAAGHVPPETVPGDLNAASGTVFTASGRALAALPAKQHMVFSGDPLKGACIVLLDHIASTWTTNQADLVGHTLPLPKPTQEVTARKLDKTPQSVSKALRSAGFPAIETALTLIESTADA